LYNGNIKLLLIVRSSWKFSQQLDARYIGPTISRRVGVRTNSLTTLRSLGQFCEYWDVSCTVVVLRVETIRTPCAEGPGHWAELTDVTRKSSMGLLCVTRSNPTHQLTDPTQPNPLQVEKCGRNSTQPNTTNSGAYSLVVTNFHTHKLSVSGTCQIGRKITFDCLVLPNLI